MLGDDSDPGWPLRAAIVLVLIPVIGRLLVRSRLSRSTNGLVVLRETFMSFVLAIVGFGVVLVFLWPSQSKEPPAPGLALGLIAVGAAGGLAVRFIERPLVCESLAGTYRTRFFLRAAFAESAALFGFVGFFIASEWWVYPAGAAIALIGFARAAPTRTHLLRDQDQLREQGCSQSLIAALNRPPAPGPNPRGL